jgi:beta-glucosidase
MANLQFPKDFLWGAATASHQVEGDNYNDWSEWERNNSKRLAVESESKFGHLPNWYLIKDEAKNPDNYISGLSSDHYHKYKDDFDIAKNLSHNAHRFSIEWSRIEPEEGKFDQKEIEHYRSVILALKDRGLEPFVTLWHWTIPIWLEKKGGIVCDDFSFLFGRYVEKICTEFSNDVKYWVTLNEPDVVSSHAYLKGYWPPQEKSIFKYFNAIKSLVSAHKKSYLIIKKINPNFQIGIAKHQVSFELGKKTLLNKVLLFIGDYLWNKWFLNKIKFHQDYIGLNHYNRSVVNNGFYKNKNEKLTDFGWEYYPESIYQSLIDLKRFKKPVYITENGIADSADIMRAEFIQRALKSVHRAILDGVDVKGYLYWSLLDNFEWDKGYWPRFGLVEIDYKTLERRVRPSAYVYKEIIENGIQ